MATRSRSVPATPKRDSAEDIDVGSCESTEWGSVWVRDELPLKVRSLVTLAVLTALRAPHELAGHVSGALNNGCTEEEIRAVLLHCAVYAGVPASAEAFEAAQEVINSFK